jgi:hypothetical protein
LILKLTKTKEEINSDLEISFHSQEEKVISMKNQRLLKLTNSVQQVPVITFTQPKPQSSKKKKEDKPKFFKPTQEQLAYFQHENLNPLDSRYNSSLEQFLNEDDRYQPSSRQISVDDLPSERLSPPTLDDVELALVGRPPLSTLFEYLDLSDYLQKLQELFERFVYNNMEVPQSLSDELAYTSSRMSSLSVERADRHDRVRRRLDFNDADSNVYTSSNNYLNRDRSRRPINQLIDEINLDSDPELRDYIRERQRNQTVPLSSSIEIGSIDQDNNSDFDERPQPNEILSSNSGWGSNNIHRWASPNRRNEWGNTPSVDRFLTNKRFRKSSSEDEEEDEYLTESEDQ